MKIRDVDFGKLFLAPMAGVSDVGFREQAVKFGADTTVTEMLSARAMFHNPKKTKLMTITSPLEKVVVAQIFGHESEYMKKAVESPILASFSSIDINMGCPAPKIIKNGEGGALMDNLPLASEIIKACKEATIKPLSVKFRKGYKKENYLDFAKMCEDSGADFITFHARGVEQGYSGHADYEAIANVKAKVKIPIVGNGDVVDLASYNEMLKTGVDAVMIGRGAMGNPWIFSELKGLNLSNLDKHKVVKEHIETLRKFYDEEWLKLYIRKHLLWYAKNLPLASNVRLTLATCQDIDACVEILGKCFLENN